MAENRVYNYEAMFVISQAVAVDLQGVVDHIKEILTKNGATIFAMKKWDERRFAFEMQKQKRGVYLLVYFSAPAASMIPIDRAATLSEKILRQLVTRADHLTVEEMQAADGQKDLEVEAKLRAQQAAEGITEASTVTTAAERQAAARPAAKDETADDESDVDVDAIDANV